MQTSVTSMPERRTSVLKDLILRSLSILCGFLLFISVITLSAWDILKDRVVIEQITTHPLVLSQIRSFILESAIVTLSPSQSWDPKVLSSLNEQALPDFHISLMLQSIWPTLLEWLEQPSIERPEIAWDLRVTKEFLRSPDGKAALLSIIRALPPCSSASGISGVQMGLQNCLPKDTSLVTFADRYGEILQLALPDQITLTMLVEQGMISPNFLSTLGQIRHLILQIRQTAIICLGIAFLLFIMLIIIGPTDDNNRLKILQFPLLLTTMLSLSTLIGLYGLLSALGGQIDLLNHFSLLKPILRILGFELSRRWLIATALFGGCYGLSVMATLGWQRLQKINQASTKPSEPRRSRLRKEFR
jgi:hypothetical protein